MPRAKEDKNVNFEKEGEIIQDVVEDSMPKKDSPPPEMIIKASVKTATPVAKTKKVNIIIEKQDSIDGLQDVNIMVNGIATQIKRGYVVSVPEEIVEVLKNAVITKVIKDDNGNEAFVDMPRFTWRVVS